MKWGVATSMWALGSPHLELCIDFQPAKMRKGIPGEGNIGELVKGVKVESAPGKASEAFKVCSVSRSELSMMKEPIALEQASQEARRRVAELDISCGCKS